MNRFSVALIINLSLLNPSFVEVASNEKGWPQILGPLRNGVYTGPELATSWPESGPAELWRVPIGAGLAGPVVSNGRLIIFHRIRNEEVVEAFDALTGGKIWRYAYRTSYRDDFGFDEGPRAVPVVTNGRVFTFGAQGQLTALDAVTGKPIWERATMAEFNVPKNFFGQSGSPVVSQGLVIANIGGLDAGIVAFNEFTGNVVWTATRQGASYSSPALGWFDNELHAVFLTRTGLLGVKVRSGKIGFKKYWRARMLSSVNAATPLIFKNRVFVSAEYGPGAGLLEVSGETLMPVWDSNQVMSNHYATSVHKDGYLYGFHGRQEFSPSFRAVNLETGQISWSEERFGGGSVTLTNEHLLIAHENGELIMVPATPAEFSIVTRAKVLAPTVRALPAVASGVVYLRNNDTLVALDLRRN
tara:strand:- start:1258 stop:2502 length:1245 start_codon:yes stop_codon:yes gene_type:complete